MGFSRQEYWSGLPFPSPGDAQAGLQVSDSFADGGTCGRGTAGRLLTPELGAREPWGLEKAGQEFFRRREGLQRVDVFRAGWSGGGGAKGGSRKGGILDTKWRSFWGPPQDHES